MLIIACQRVTDFQDSTVVTINTIVQNKHSPPGYTLLPIDMTKYNTIH